MAQRDIIVIGASSGGVEALTRLVSGLPADFPAALFVVLHVRPDVPSHLPAILNRAGQLPAAHAVDQEPVRRGRIYIAPPGMQTYLTRGRLRVRRGPRENNQRPAIDPLFRTAAHFYGSRVIGVVLSGALDDGTAGLLAVKRAEGIAIVQDPRDATFPDMPQNALSVVDVDFALNADELAPQLIRLACSEIGQEQIRFEIPLETVEEASDPSDAFRSDQLGKASNFTCPECNGTLYEITEEAELRFRCRVGHAYSEKAMISAQDESVERALWAALRALEERSALMKKLADLARRRGQGSIASAYEERSRSIEADVDAIHTVITS